MKRLCLLPLLVCGLLALAACDTSNGEGPDVSVIDLQVGAGEEAVEGARVTVHYIGRLTTGDVFDSSYQLFNETLDEDRPITFTLGAGQVIRGWERGVPGMRVGGKRRLIIPPALAYGNQAQGCPPECNASPPQNCDQCLIPANSTLLFDIDLLDVRLP